MAYQISQTDPAALSTEELLKEIDGFTQLAVEVVQRYALILTELRKRKSFHAFMRHPVLSFFQSIADGAMHPEAALILANKDMISAVLPLPPERQIAVARGEAIPVASVTREGDIKSDDMPIHRMDPGTMRRAFGPEGIRPVHEQAEIIRAEGKIERHGMITVLRDEGLIKVGNQKIRPEDLRGPLLALGYRLDLAREARPDEIKRKGFKEAAQGAAQRYRASMQILA